MGMKEQQEQNNLKSGYLEIPFETDQLYKKYFVNIDLVKLENRMTKKQLLEDYNEKLELSLYKTTGIKFDVVVHNGVLARTAKGVHAGNSNDLDKIKEALPKDRFSEFAHDFCIEPIVVELRNDNNEMNILFYNSGEKSSPASIMVNSVDSSKATLNCYYFSGETGPNSINGVAEFFNIEKNSDIKVNEIHCESEKTDVLVTRSFDTYDGSKLEFNAFYTGGTNSRQKSFFRNSGIRSQIKARESIIGTGNQKFDLSMNMSNLKTNSKCDYEVRAVLADNSYGIIKSLAKMAVNVEGSESYIKERGLIYDKGARITMMPDMSIEESYVKASHSSSTSPVPEEDIFYISSRGIDKEKSKFLVGSGLIYELLKEIRSDEVKAFSMLVAKYRLETKNVKLPEVMKNYGVWYD